MRWSCLAWFVVASVAGAPGSAAPPSTSVEAKEIGAADVDWLPGGKEADGIIGDFVLRNAHIEAVISSNQPLRKANMSTNWDSLTQGCLYDLCLRGSKNDQLTCFAPGDQKGSVSYVLRNPHPEPGESEIYVERSAERGQGHRIQHRYLLRSNWHHIVVLTTYSNRAAKPWKINPDAAVKGLLGVKAFGGVSFGDAMNPRDRQGYAWAAVKHAGAEANRAEATLAPGAERLVALAVAPGNSPAEAYGVIAALRGPVGHVSVRVRAGETPVTTATINIKLSDKVSVPAYTDSKGEARFALPPGNYAYDLVDIGRTSQGGTLEVKPGGQLHLDLKMDAASRIRFEITAPQRANLPCKVQLVGVSGTKNPHFGVDIQARGCRNQYHSERGRFTLPVPPGDYLAIITRGIEYSHATRLVNVKPGREATVVAELRQIVDTRGWISADFHNHSTPSGDNYCGTDDRVINLAAEHIEFAPTTEHNRFYDWGPHIKKLGLATELSTIVGIELTGDGAHFNAFPFKVVPHRQDGGAPTWQTDPRINAIALRDYQGGGPDRYVQINHPSVGKFFRDRDGDGKVDGGYPDLELLIDGAEVWSTEILNSKLWYKDRNNNMRENRTFAWLQLLNQGRYMYCVAVSDAHSVFGNGVGGWRTYVPSSTDAPARIDYREIIRNAKAGRMYVTNGPILDVKLQDGTLPGGHTILNPLKISVGVQCTDWIDIDRVQILVNGRQVPKLNFTRAKNPNKFGSRFLKFVHTLDLTLTEDAHIIVAAVGEGFDLKTGYGESWQSQMHPCAFTNPIFVDHNGDGFRANGDNLGQPLPTGKQP